MCYVFVHITTGSVPQPASAMTPSELHRRGTAQLDELSALKETHRRELLTLQREMNALRRSLVGGDGSGGGGDGGGGDSGGGDASGSRLGDQSAQSKHSPHTGREVQGWSPLGHEDPYSDSDSTSSGASSDMYWI